MTCLERRIVSFLGRFNAYSCCALIASLERGSVPHTLKRSTGYTTIGTIDNDDNNDDNDDNNDNNRDREREKNSDNSGKS